MMGLYLAIVALAQASQAAPVITISAAEIARAPRLTIAREPIWRIGGEADGPYSFTRLVGGTFTRRGVAVMEFTPLQVRLFSTEGKHVASFGRQGRGPGEFAEVQRFMLHIGDSLIVSQIASVSVFDATGKHARTVSMGNTAAGFTSAVRMFPNGQMLALRRAIPTRSQNEGIRREVARVVVLTPLGDSLVADLGERLLAETVIARVGEALVHTGRAFGAGQLLEGTDSLVLAMQTETANLAIFALSGRPLRTIAFRLTPRAVTAADREEFARVRRAGARDARQRQMSEAYLKIMPYPEQMPYFDALRWSSDRTIKIRRYVAPLDTVAQWLSLTPLGRLVSVIDLPTKSRVMDFAADRVLLVERDADDVEYLSLYRLGAVGPKR